jgi:hypothetical protein
VTEISLRVLESWREAAREASRYEFYPSRLILSSEPSEEVLERLKAAWDEEAIIMEDCAWF